MFFNRKKSLIDTGVFQGFTDCHCHILPGVDDGIQRMDDALAVLEYYRQLGVKEVWLTPHIMEEIPNTVSELKERFQELQEEYHRVASAEADGPAITLHLAAENMIDSLFSQRLESGELLPYGAPMLSGEKMGQGLLMETSYVQPPYGFKSILNDVRKAGYTPVLAHPERYLYMDYDEYDTLRDMGVLFQMNLPSLAGAYNPEVKRRAEYLLSSGYYSFMGTDLHSLSHFQKTISRKEIKKDIAVEL